MTKSIGNKENINLSGHWPDWHGTSSSTMHPHTTFLSKLQKEVLSCVIVMFFCTAYTSSISIFQHNQVSPPPGRIAAMQPNGRNGLLSRCRRFHMWCAGCFVPWLLCRRVCY